MSAQPLLPTAEEELQSGGHGDRSTTLTSWSSEMKTIPVPLRSQQSRPNLIKGLSLVVQITLCGLLAVNAILMLHQRPVATWTATDAKSKSVKYGNDVQYMSLDHKYDDLWSEFSSGQNGMIRINPDRMDEEPEWGAIGM